MSRNIFSRTMAVASLLVPILAGSAAWADNFKLIPNGSIKEEFNDNVFFSAGARESSFITTLSAGLSLIDMTERLSTKMDLHLDGLLYSADDDLNSLDQRYQALVNYRLTPLVKVGLTAGFTHGSRPDRFIESSGQVISRDSNHQQYSLTGEVMFSEKMNGIMTYAYENTGYRDAAVSDVEGHNGVLGLVYDLERLIPLLKGRTSISFSSSRYSLSTTDNATVTTGISYRLHELWSVDADLGIRYSHSSFSRSGGADDSNNDVGEVAALRVSYKDDIDYGSLNFSQSIQNAAGRSGAVELTALNLEIGRRFSTELTGATAFGFYRNYSEKDEFASQRIDETTMRFSPSLRYEFSPKIAVDAFYEYALVHYRVNDTEARRNKVFLRLTVQDAIFE